MGYEESYWIPIYDIDNRVLKNTIQNVNSKSFVRVQATMAITQNGIPNQALIELSHSICVTETYVWG